MKRGVEERRHRYHMPEVPNGLLTVTAEARSYNSGEKASVTDNREQGRKKKRVNGKQKKGRVGRLKIQKHENKSRQTQGQGGRHPPPLPPQTLFSLHRSPRMLMSHCLRKTETTNLRTQTAAGRGAYHLREDTRKFLCNNFSRINNGTFLH